MKIEQLARVKGTLSIIVVLHEESLLNSTTIINRISESRDTFYRAIKRLRDMGVVERLIMNQSVDGLGDRELMVWRLTDKGKKIASLLDAIQQLL